MPLLKSMPAILLLCLTAAGCTGPGAATDTTGQTPYLRNGEVGIKPGESYAITGRIEAGKLVDLRYSDSVPEAEKTADLRYGVPALKAENVLAFSLKPTNFGMTLTAQNSFPETVKFHAAMQLANNPKLQKTSTCPIKPGGAIYELWPNHPIALLVLADFRILPPGSPHICEW